MYKLIIGVTNTEACSKSKWPMSLITLCYNMGVGQTQENEYAYLIIHNSYS